MPRTTFDPATGQWLVAFRLPAEAGARRAWLSGDFNDWSTDATPLEAQPDGSLTVTLALDAGRTYRFRYFLGDGRWDNDWEADAYVANDFGGADSVVVTPPPVNGNGHGYGDGDGDGRGSPGARLPASHGG